MKLRGKTRRSTSATRSAVLQGVILTSMNRYSRPSSSAATATALLHISCAIMGSSKAMSIPCSMCISANGGVNPSNGERIISPYAVSRTLSVMTSSGMYDFAGEWIYRVGIPAKSGVGGGIMAALPAQFGLGSFSPLLDEHGNSVRGLKVCEQVSAHFDLHMLNGTSDVRSCIVADYDFARVSLRGRQPHEQKILDEHERDVRVIELTGTL